MLTVPSVTPDAISALSSREMRRAVMRRWLFRFSVLIGWAAFIGVWYFFSRLVFNPQQLPEPHVVAGESWTLITERDFRTNMQASLVRVLGGFLLAIVISCGLGWLIAYNAWWRTLLRTIVQLVVSTPIVALAILTLVVFGVSSLGPVITTAVVATPYIMMNVAQGLTGVDRRLIVMSESFGRTRSQIIAGVLLPSSLISVLAGARLAFAVAWRMELLTEIFAASEGVGFQIRRSFESYDVRGMI
ncbi:MAG: ABC transporter permease subunit, partial [Acidimicrobiaceae bacterium]|nr:ABC transporter permease subunit [Acidimicrobiaceae bacterium]